MSERLRALSLFAGIGGFDLGLERAGLTVVGQVELDPFCQRVLAARWPGVERAGDVRSVRRLQPGDGPDDADARGGAEGKESAVDILVGGFPCQDLSVAGKRAGLGGERSGLFWEIVRIAKAPRPTWGIFENVPGLVSSNRGSDMALVIAGLRECWPVVGWRILDSRYFGVAQRRRRVFFVCGPTEAGVAAVLALTEGSEGDPEAGGEAGARAPGATVFGTLNSGGNSGGFRTEPAEHLVSHALSAGAGGSKFGSGRDGQDDFVIADPISANEGRTYTHEGKGNLRLHNVVGTPDSLEAFAFESRVARNGRGAPDEIVPPLKAESGQTGKGDGAPLVFEARHFTRGEGGPPGELVPSLKTHKTGGPGDAEPIVAYRKAQKAHDPEDCERWEEDGITDTLAGHGATTAEMIHAASAVRRLTPLECERLQGFPDGWTCLCQPLEAYAADPDAAALACTCPDSPRYRALGNAVTVNVIEWLGRRLLRVLA